MKKIISLVMTAILLNSIICSTCISANAASTSIRVPSALTVVESNHRNTPMTLIQYSYDLPSKTMTIQYEQGDEDDVILYQYIEDALFADRSNKQIYNLSLTQAASADNLNIAPRHMFWTPVYYGKIDTIIEAGVKHTYQRDENGRIIGYTETDLSSGKVLRKGTVQYDGDKISVYKENQSTFQYRYKGNKLTKIIYQEKDEYGIINDEIIPKYNKQGFVTTADSDAAPVAVFEYNNSGKLINMSTSYEDENRVVTDASGYITKINYSDEEDSKRITDTIEISYVTI